MDVKTGINTIKEQWRVVVEMTVVSFLAGWFLIGLWTRSYQTEVGLVSIADMNIISFLFMLLFAMFLAGVLYVKKRAAARLLAFFAMAVYLLLSLKEHANQLAYALVVLAVVLLAFSYVKRDLIPLMERIPLNEKQGMVLAVCFGFGLVWFICNITVARYHTYSNSTFDFGIFAQMFENMRRTGLPLTSVERQTIGEISHFGVHISPILYLMLPFYLLFPSPVTVQVMQAVVLGLAVIPLFRLCRHYQLCEKMSAAVCLLYCLFPATAAGTFYDFHENCWLPVLIFSLILMVEKKKGLRTVVCAILLLMVKEDAALYLLVLGGYWCLSGRERRRGALLALMAILYFGVALAVLHKFGQGDLASSRYWHLMYDPDGGLWQIVITMLADPAYVLAQIGSAEKLRYLLLMLAPIGATLIQRRMYSRYLLLGTLIVFNVLPNYVYMYDIGFQYSFGAVALLLYLAVMTAAEWQEKKRISWGAMAVITAFVLSLCLNYPKLEYYREREEKYGAQYAAMDEAVASIPRDASVLASGYLVPHLWDVRHLSSIQEDCEVDQDFVAVDIRGQGDLAIVQTQLDDYMPYYEVPGLVMVFVRE